METPNNKFNNYITDSGAAVRTDGSNTSLQNKDLDRSQSSHKIAKSDRKS